MQDEKYVMFRPESFESFIRVLSDTFGTGGDSIIFNMSRKFGQTVIQNTVPAIPEDMEQLKKLIEILAEQFNRQGWGKLTLIEIDEDQHIVSVDFHGQPFDNCDLPSTTPVCFFLRGTIAGMLSVLLRNEFKVKEIDCQKDTGQCKYVFEMI